MPSPSSPYSTCSSRAQNREFHPTTSLCTHSPVSHSLEVTEELPFPWNVPVINDGELDTLALVASIASFSLQSPYTASFNLTLCAAATHENAFLPEWLVYHRLLGVERFVLFDNSPTEEMRELLRPFLDEGSVLLYELQYPRECLSLSHPAQIDEYW